MSESTEKAHDYDPIYAVDANSGLAEQPGGAALAAGPNNDLLVDGDGNLKPVEGNDVHSEGHQARLDAAAEGKSKEDADKDAEKTAGATDAAEASGPVVPESQNSEGDTTPAVVTDENGTPLPTSDDGLQVLTDQGQGSAYDPSDKSVADVKAYIAEHPEEKDAILAAEASEGGKNRATIAAL